MTFSWTLDGLEDRLKEHSEFIDSVISLIPPKYYFKNSPNSTEGESNFQPNKRRRLPKQVINEQKKQAKKRKLDPNNLKTVKEIQKELLDKIKQEKEKEQNEDDEDEDEDDEEVKNNDEDDGKEEQMEVENDDEEEGEENEERNNEFDAKDEFDENGEGEDKTKIDSSSKSIKNEPRKQLSISDRLEKMYLSKQQTNTNSSKREKRKKLKEAKRQEKKLRRKQSKINKDGEKSVNVDTKEGGDIMKNGDNKKDEDTKNGDVKKSGGIKRKISEADSQQKNGDLQFAKFDFVDEKKKKKKINDVHIMNKLQKKVEKEEELKKKDPKKAIELHEKEAWSKVFKKAQGEKVKDDPRLLKKTIKKKVISKKKSEKAWKDRIKSVEKSLDERQQKRTENIQARVAAKKNKKNKRNR